MASPVSLMCLCAECTDGTILGTGPVGKTLFRWNEVISTELTSGGNALILLEPRLGTLGQPPTLLSIARPGRRVITLMHVLDDA